MITRKHAAALAVLLGCGLSCAARADGLDYNFVDLNYSRIVPQDNPALGNGRDLGVNGSYGLPANFTVVGSVDRVSYDFLAPEQGVSDVVQTTGIGLGYHYPLLARLDLEAEIDYSEHREHFDHSGFDSPDFDTYEPDYVVGLRYLATAQLELHAYLSEGHVNGNNTDTHGLDLGLIYNFVPYFGVGLDYRRDTIDMGGNPAETSSETSHATVLFARFQF